MLFMNKSLRIIIFVFSFIVGKNFAQDNYNYVSSVPDSSIADPDSYGYRYCAYWKLADGTPLYSTCDPFNFERCGKKLEIAYRCCSGFQKVGPPVFEMNAFGNELCAKTIPQWKSCRDVLNLFPEVQPFSRLVKNAEMINDNPTEEFTIFAPQSKEVSKLYSSNSDIDNPIFYHVVRGRFHASELRDNDELVSYYKNQKLRVTRYSFGVICIDCVEITQADIECKNSVVHFIRRPLIPRSGTSFNRQNLLAALNSDPEISAFANDIPQDLQDKLKATDSRDSYTIFPVKNDDWNKIKSNYQGKDLEAIIRNHIILKVHCTAALHNSVRKLTSLSGNIVDVECTTKGNTEVRSLIGPDGSKSKIISQDNMATNGVYHTVDKASVPASVRPFSEIIQNPQLISSKFPNSKKYLEYIKDCDLKMEPNKKYAILLPDDASFEWWKNYDQFKPEYNRFLNDKEYRCRVARYHIVEQNPELQKISRLKHEPKGYKTNNPDLLHQVNYFMKDRDRSDMYFHYSKVQDFKSTKIKGGSVYPISRVNVIPEKFIVDVLKEDPKLKLTSLQVQNTSMDKLVFKPNRPLNLFLATQDEGLINQTTGKLNSLIAGYTPEGLKNFLLLHSVPLYLWGGDIGYFKKNTIHKFMSRAGQELIFWMDNQGVMRIGYESLPKDKWAEVVKFNLPAKDGMVWLLKRNIPCPKTLCPHKHYLLDFDYFDFYAVACQISELPGIKDVKDAKKKFNAKPIEIGEANPDKCVLFKQPTYKVGKRVPEKKP